MNSILRERIYKLTSRHCLWWFLAVALACQSLVLIFLTQGSVEAVNAMLVWGGALLLLQEQGPGWGARPGKAQVLAGATLVLAVLWRGQQITGHDGASSLLPLLAGVALSLLATPARNLKPYGKALLIMSLLPAVRMTNRFSTVELSLITARITQLLLMFCGLPVQVLGNIVQLPGGSVQVAGSCSGLSMLVQLIGVGLIFALAFPMRHFWQNGLMVLVAALLAVFANSIRIALLALISASTVANKNWWFVLFHEGEGSLIFSGVAVLAFVWLYGLWMKWQVASLGASHE